MAKAWQKDHLNIFSRQDKWISRFEEEKSQIRISVALGASQGEIVNHSENLPGALSYKKSDFSYIKQVQQLIPPPLSLVHDELIP